MKGLREQLFRGRDAALDRVRREHEQNRPRDGQRAPDPPLAAGRVGMEERPDAPDGRGRRALQVGTRQPVVRAAASPAVRALPKPIAVNPPQLPRPTWKSTDGREQGRAGE